MKNVAVLVINYNGKKYLDSCLKSLQSQTYKDFEVYLIDNGSSDGSVEYVRRNFPEVKIIKFDTNLGFAKAYNIAVNMVETKYVVFLNNDTIVDKEWLKNLYDEIVKDENIFAVGSKILLMDDKNRLHNAGSKIAPWGGGYDIGFLDYDRKCYNVKREVGAVCGASMIVRRDLFQKIGGFDDSFFAYFEDVDLCWRAWIYGYKVIYNPKSIVYHKLGGTWGRFENPRKIYFSTRNRLFTLIKNFKSLSDILKGILLSLPLDFLRVMFSLRNGNGHISYAILKAYYNVISHLRDLFKKRREIQHNRVISDDYLKKKGLIASTAEFINFAYNFVKNVFLKSQSKPK